jgi:glucose-1-phosphatase
MSHIKNIVFDLGGVLLDIDPALTHTAFEKLGIKDFKNNYSLNKADKLFDKLETGHVTEPAFYDAIRLLSNTQLSDEAIKNAWNALLLNFRAGSLQWMEQNSHRFNFYLLSNTNHIHHVCFSEHFKKQTGKPNFDDYFTKAYYSHDVGLRKPDASIFEFVLSDAGIAANETLFIDDLLKNIEAANAVGIKTHHLLEDERIETLGLS